MDDHHEAKARHASDGELLHRFVTQQDEAAFREIVHRYTPLVMGVAMRTTHDPQAAEDVLQATFLVLVEKAESLGDPTQIAAWLHGVAMRIARRLVDKRHRHREQPHRHENHVMDPAAATDPFERVCQTRDHDVLGEELQKLPEKFRTPMVLRYLEDLSNEQVAERLGLKVSTVEGRLKRGKKELRRRLARRGVTLGAALLVWNMTQQAVAAAPVAGLTDAVATTALAWQSPTPALAPPTDAAMSLAQQEITLMSTLKLTTAGTIAGAVLLTAGLLVAMSGLDEGLAPAVASGSTAPVSIDTSVSNAVGSDADSQMAQPDEPAADLTVVDQDAEESSAAGTASAFPDRAKPNTIPNNATQVVEVFQLQHVDAELAHRMLSGFFGSVTDETDNRHPVLRVNAEENRLIVRGEQSVQELTKVILQKLDELAEQDLVKLAAAERKPDPTVGKPSPAETDEVYWPPSSSIADPTAAKPSPAETSVEEGTTPAATGASPEVISSVPIAGDHETVKPQGAIRTVDESTGIVWLNLGADDGLRPQVRFRVHSGPESDGDTAAGRFKGYVEVVRITGPHLAEARIINESLERPMTAGDVVYSPSWTPGVSDDGEPASADEPETTDSTEDRAKEIKFFTLQNANAESAVQMLKELVASADGQLAGAGDAAPPAFSFDARTNSVLAYGDPEYLKVIEAVLLRIDQSTEQKSKPDAAGSPNRAAAEPTDDLLNSTDTARPAGAQSEVRRIMAYPVQHVEPEEFSRLLDALFPSASSEAGRAHPRIAVDRRQRMLIVNGTEQHHEQIKTLIQIIDTPEPQQQQTQQRDRPAQTPAGDTDAGISVERRNNTLILRGPKEQVEFIGDLADRLDHPPHETPSEEENAVSSSAQSALQHAPLSTFDITPRSPAGQKLQRALREPTSIKAEGKSFNEILKDLADRHEIDVHIHFLLGNSDAFDNEEWFEMLSPLGPVKFLNDVPLSTALDRLLRYVPSGMESDAKAWSDFNSRPVTYFIQDETLVIAPREVAEQTMQVRTYDLRPFDQPGVSIDRAAVVEAVRTTTGESTWVELGGRGTMVEGDHTLVIRQSPLVHREIEALLEQLLHAAEATAGPAE